MDATSPPNRSKPAWLPFACIIAASALAHLWCLGSVFFLDDAPAIKQNPVLLTGRFWEGGMNAVTYLGYLIQYRLFGLSTPGFHAVNWLLHTAIACVLFALGRDLLENRERWRIAWFGALLFAVHPLASEIPNYARTQDLAWVTLFSLLASWALLRFFRDGDWKKLLVCAGFALGAIFSKGPGLFHVTIMTGVIGVAFLSQESRALLRRRAGVLGAAALLGLLLLWWSGALAKFMAGTGAW